MNYDAFFKRAYGGTATPFPYQRLLAEESWPAFLEIPTGLGKTAAVLLAWAWKRGWRPDGKRVAPDSETPRRLVYCLPMRVLVEQTQVKTVEWLRNLGLFGEAGDNKISVHLLMGGEEGLRKASWAEHPEEDQVLIGTQDMLLSRALMRGYGMSRYQWPVHFGLLHNDAFWVFDEVQLMGPGLVTSAQLEAFRKGLGGALMSRSLWLSATLRRDWLRTVDFDPSPLRTLKLTTAEKKDAVVRDRYHSVKALEKSKVALKSIDKKGLSDYLQRLADRVGELHLAGTVTLVVVNTVGRSQGLAEALRKKLETRHKPKKGSLAAADVPEIVLVHSRFREVDRRAQEAKLVSAVPAAGRIIVATQAIEAGVDLSSRTLMTELAPWPSMVQRFGRCNRYGEFKGREDARVEWVDLAEDVDVARPYEPEQLKESRRNLRGLKSAAPSDLPTVEAEAPLCPVIRRKDFLDLFNTDPDLSGFDVDIAPYIRDADEADALVFWRAWEGKDPNKPEIQCSPAREEICRVGLGPLKELLDRLDAPLAWTWDPLSRKWNHCNKYRLRPGLTVLLHTGAAGYRPDLGFHPASKEPVGDVKGGFVTEETETYSDDHRSYLQKRVELARHLDDVQKEAEGLCVDLGVEHKTELVRAARWHDWGKLHPAFQGMLLNADAACSAGGPWAKAAEGSRGRARYVFQTEGREQERRHFRHELASALAFLARQGYASDDSTDLTAFLIAAHHGKVRMGLRSLPDEKEPIEKGRLFARGVWDGDRLPGCVFSDDERVGEQVVKLDLMQIGEGPLGPSWTARTQGLLKRHGPFQLAWWEALVRLADWRASRKELES